MLRSLAVIVVAMSGVVSAPRLPLHAQEEYPHAFPREGTVKLVDNERVTVWEVNWLNGVRQPYHRHQFDMAGVYLRYGPITVTRPDGTTNPPSPPFPIPRPYFQAKGVTHREEALNPPGTPERLAIMVDLKETQVPPFTPSAQLTRSFPRSGARNVLENERVRMWDYTWKPGASVPLHVHDTDAVEVFLDPGTIVARSADGKETSFTAAFKSARFVPRGTVDSEQATAGSPRAIVIELK
jgi:hypothetical protein